MTLVLEEVSPKKGAEPVPETKSVVAIIPLIFQLN